VSRAYRFRFLALYATLVVAAGAAIGVAIWLATRPAPPPPPRWSAWQPSGDSPLERVRSIASHVQTSYRASDGKPLVTVRGGPLTAYGEQLALYKRADTQTTDVSRLDGENVEYQLCGPAENCALNATDDVAARSTLAKREGLELALFTFHYVDSVDNVVVTIPSIGTSTTNHSLLVRRSDRDVAAKLKHPLRLPGGTKSTKLSMRDAQSIALLTDPHLYEWTIGQVGNSVAFVVNPLSLKQAPEQSDAGATG
jgi:hypothetical protein